MADSKKDDVAAALAALAGGQVPSEHETPSGGIPSESTVFSPPVPKQPVPKQPAKKAPPTPPAAAEFRPARPPTVEPPRAMPQPPATPAAIPAARIRPAAPSIGTQGEASSPAPPRQRPAAPQRAVVVAPAEPPAVQETEDPNDASAVLSHIVEDDEMDAPAADISTLARTHAVKKRKAGAPIYANIKFRQTVIPFLLTNGILLPAIGAWALLAVDSPLHNGGMLLPLMLFGVGFALLAAGVLNAMQVKQILLQREKPA